MKHHRLAYPILWHTTTKKGALFQVRYVLYNNFDKKASDSTQFAMYREVCSQEAVEIRRKVFSVSALTFLLSSAIISKH